jgi:hypothetical protein
MILRLALAQARAQKRYTAWTAALLTLVLTFTTFGLIVFANQLIINRDLQEVQVSGRANNAWVESLVGVDSPEPNALERTDRIPLEDIHRAVEAAVADGSDVVAVRQASVQEYSSQPVVGWVPPIEIRAVAGAYDWDVMLVEGSVPEPGEIAISAEWARDRGLGIGNSIRLSSYQGWDGYADTSPPSTWTTYEISGLIKSCGDHFGYSTYCPQGFLSWEESAAPGSPFTYLTSDFDGTTGLVTWTEISYNIDAPSLQQFDGLLQSGWYASYDNSVPSAAWLAAGVAALFVVGMIVMAFAVGRAQAQTRMTWVATARTLGATKRAVVTASVIETLLIAVASTAAALVLGTLAAVAHRAIHLSVVAHPFIPDHLSIPWWMFAGVAGSGLVLAAIVSAVPAFWAARVSPVAALKPVNEVMEAEVSRKVHARWLVPPFVLGVVALLVGAGPNVVGQVAATLGGIVAIPTGFFLILEGLRLAIPALGRRLSRAHRPWAIAAGDALALRPRQGVAPALLQSITLGIGALAVTLVSFRDAEQILDVQLDGSIVSSPMVEPEYRLAIRTSLVMGVLAVFVIIQVVSLAIAFVGQRATSADSATRRALGLSRSGQRRATFVQYVAPQMLGIVSGAVVGFLAAPFVRVSNSFNVYFGTTTISKPILEPWIRAAGMCGVLVTLALGVAAVGGLIVAASTGSRTPVEALRQVG